MIAAFEAGRRPGSGRCRGPLALRRAALGLTQGGLADAIGADRVTVYRWERGTMPSPRYRRQLATALALSLVELAELLEENAGVVR